MAKVSGQTAVAVSLRKDTGQQGESCTGNSLYELTVGLIHTQARRLRRATAVLSFQQSWSLELNVVAGSRKQAGTAMSA